VWKGRELHLKKKGFQRKNSCWDEKRGLQASGKKGPGKKKKEIVTRAT